MDVVTLGAAKADARRNHAARPGGAYLADGVTRRVMMPIGEAKTAASALVRDFNQRTPIKFPVRPTRMRLRYANHNLLAGTIPTSPVTIVSAYIGEATFTSAAGDNRRWSADYATAPTQIVTGPLSVPTDGTDLVTNWVTVPPAIADKTITLSLGIQTAATGTGVVISDAGVGVRGGTSANAGNQTLPGASYEEGKIFLDLRVEYEFQGSNRIVAFIGDSITAGYTGSALAPEMLAGSSSGVAQNERWPDVAASIGNFAAVNLAFSSAFSASFYDTSGMQWSRAAIGTSTTVPDAGVIALGTNSLTSAFAALTGDTIGAINAMKALGIRKVYLSTLLPRSNPHGTLSALASPGATTVSSSISVAAGEEAVIGIGADYEVVNVSAVTGSGPYTLTVGALTKTHASGSRIVGAAEARRIRYNNWVRGLPAGVDGVIDFEQVMEATPNGPDTDPRYIATDKLHPSRLGTARMGHAVAVLGNW